MIRGVSATKFTPYGTITRQQAALMLERTLEYLGVDRCRKRVKYRALPHIHQLKDLDYF
ncbi:hypothetical protein COM00_21960 [Bacillus toyonensis]|uniref:SLH domain-containing protein n=1 Tax=Bacillus toyonensis TaxID=155322 RepID=A0AB73QRZ3_9BACI|nr:hypothetical protein CN678_32020 [Bacillus toyonensis]PGB58755.1 hypothetical protein COM00_21960 [Bacillus toyonensis]